MTDKSQNVFFIAVGRLEYQKGYDLLIEIFKKFKGIIKDNNKKLYLIGDGSQKRKLEDLIQRYNLQDDIIMTGAIKDVKHYYSLTKVFILTSRWEGMPVVIDEAFYFGLPVIAFDCETGPREMIDDGVNGYLIPMNDIDGFVEKMVLLSQDYQLLSRLSSNCSKAVSKRCDRAILEKWQNLFKQLGEN